MASKILEIIKKHKTQNYDIFEKMEDRADVTSVNKTKRGWKIENFFNFQGVNLLIESDLFFQILVDFEYLKILRIFPSWESSCLSDFSEEYNGEFMDSRNILMKGVKLGRYFPEASKEDFIDTISFVFDKVSKKMLVNVIKYYDKSKKVKSLFNNAPQNIVYDVTFDMWGRILINGLCLSTPFYGEQNETIFRYIHQNSKREVKIEEMVWVDKDKVRLRKVVENLGFEGKLKKLFFPKTSAKSVFFHNPITKEDFLKEEFDEFRNFNLEEEITRIRNSRVKKKSRSKPR